MITAYLDSKLKDKFTAFAVILKYENIVWKRSVPNGMTTLNSTLLNAVKYVVLSIASSYKSEKLVINTRNKYICDLFSKDGDVYRTTPSSNIELVTNIRELINGMNIEFALSSAPEVDECNNLALQLLTDNSEVFVRS